MKRLRRGEDGITSYTATYDLVAFMDKNWLPGLVTLENTGATWRHLVATPKYINYCSVVMFS
jgi:hypothetical protein